MDSARIGLVPQQRSWRPFSPKLPGELQQARLLALRRVCRPLALQRFDWDFSRVYFAGAGLA